ncbi:MAG: hypothetical protein CK429_35885 [Mycobacterium sp.]|nr:MAG: hypothetical protein CK429_35885 [Mycobacterium sp.]
MGEVLRFPECGDDGDATLTVKDVAEASGLPQPVIAQLVPRTWTRFGWMYTAAQLQEAVVIAERLAEQRRAAAGGTAASQSGHREA